MFFKQTFILIILFIYFNKIITKSQKYIERPVGGKNINIIVFVGV